MLLDILDTHKYNCILSVSSDLEEISMEYEIGKIIHTARMKKNMSMREVCRSIEHNRLCGTTISPAYLSQVESHSDKVKTHKISFDFFWAISVILELDPIELFVLSRTDIPQQMREPAYRKKIFSQSI